LNALGLYEALRVDRMGLPPEAVARRPRHADGNAGCPVRAQSKSSGYRLDTPAFVQRNGKLVSLPAVRFKAAY